MTIHDFLAKIGNLHRALATEMFYAISFICEYQGPSKQVRSSGEPYLEHLAEVAWNVMCIGTAGHCTGIPHEMLDDETIIATILHDIIEDTDVTHEQLRKVFAKGRGARFGKRVADMVMAVSKKPIEEFENDEMARTEEAFNRLISYAKKDWQVLTIKVEDRKHNMRTLDGLNSQPERQKRIATMTIDVLVPFLQNEALQLIPHDYHHWLKTSIDELYRESAKYLPDDYEIVIRKKSEQNLILTSP